MTDQPDEPLEIHRLREDDADLDQAGEGDYQGDDALIRKLQKWGQDAQEGTEHPTRKE